jgi:hypothetical protein
MNERFKTKGRTSIFIVSYFTVTHLSGVGASALIKATRGRVALRKLRESNCIPSGISHAVLPAFAAATAE